MKVDMETEYEKRVRRWKKIFFILTVFMVLGFSVFIADVYSVIKKKTPYVIENCEFVVENEYIGKKPVNIKDVEARMKEYLFSYEIRNISFVFDPCMGWKGEAWKNNTIEKIITICEDGKVLIYKKECKKRDLPSSISNLIEMLFAKVFKWG